MNGTINRQNKPLVRKMLYESIVVLFLAIIIWLPRGFSLDSFVSTDEIAWLVRSANFYFALGQRDWGGTFQNGTPGVTTMWVNTIAFLIEYPEYRGWGQGQFDSFHTFEKFTDSRNIDPHKVLITGRSIMVGIHTLLLILGFYLAKRLMGFLPALLGFLMISLEPFYIGLTRLSHLDGLVGTLSIVSLLAFMVYGYQDQKLIYLIISAMGTGAAVLTKITGFIIFPVLGFILAFMLLLYVKDPTRGLRQPLKKWTLKLLGHLSIFGIVFMLTQIIFWPAMWRNPSERLIHQFILPLGFLPEETDAPSEQPDDDPQSRVDDKPQSHISVGYIIRYPKLFLWRVSPLGLIGLLIGSYLFFKKEDIFQESKIRRVSWTLLASGILFTILLTIPQKSNFRYWIPGYLSLLLFSGIGWLSVFNIIRKCIPDRNRNLIPLLIIMGLFTIQLLDIGKTFPYFFSYYNPLLGGGKRATRYVMVGQGEGLDQAGHYLSGLPNSDTSTVMSWYGWGCFSFYYSGETIIFPVTREWTSGLAEKLRKSDYLVTYVNQWYRRIPSALYDSLDKSEPYRTIWVDGIEYVRIYEVDSLPVEVFNPE